MMNRDHRQLNALYIHDRIKPLVRAKVVISVAVIQAAVAQMTGSYLCT